MKGVVFYMSKVVKNIWLACGFLVIVALSEDELEKVQKAIFNDKLDNLLKNMFQKKKESRKYARDFIEKHVESVIKDRERITEKEILEAVEISKNVFVV